MRRALRVLFLDHTARLGGGEIALLNLLRALDRNAIEPACVIFEEGPLVDRLRKENAPVEVLEVSESVNGARKDALGIGSALRLGVGSVRFIRTLARTIRRHDVDLVYCNSLKSDLLGGLAARVARVNCVWSVHDRIEADYLPAKVVRAFRFAARRIPAGVIVNSRTTLETLHLPATKPVVVAYPGIEVPEQAADAVEGDPVVTIIGRLAPWKGQHIFLDAAARVRAAMPECRFRIVGSAMFGEEAYEQQLRLRGAQVDLGDAVEFRGFRDDVAREMAESTLVVHASVTPEPFGLVITEAMAAGRAVVATDAGGARETVVHNETGLLVPTSDPGAMAEAILKLLGDAPLRQQMASAGRERVKAHFSIAHTARTVTEFLQRIASLRSVPEPQPASAEIASPT